MRELSLRDAICEAMRQEMRRDPRVLLLGEDVGAFGGPLKTSRGLIDEFGSKRIIETPICEQTMVGMGVGAALMGYRPIVEVMFMDLMSLAMDQTVNHAAKMRYLSGGDVGVPMVIRTATGVGFGHGVHHSQSFESWFIHVPGLKVVMPITPYDAKGLLISAIRDPDPVLFLEHKRLYATKGLVPEEVYALPLNQAEIKREGADVTIVAYGLMVSSALAASEELAQEGISAEVIDLRSLSPLDRDTILGSVQKTGKVVITHEAWKIGGVGAEVSALIAEEALAYLDAPIQRVAAPHAHVPYSPKLEEVFLPNSVGIVQAVRAAVGAA